MQYTDNDKFLMPWGKYQGKLTIAEMVKKDPGYAKYISKPDEVKARIIQELETPTQTNIPADGLPEHQEDGAGWSGDSQRPF